MSQAPETRLSLLLKIRNAENRQAWEEFVQIYRPMIFRLAGLRGMQDADAEDLAQQVLLSVSGAIERWEADPQRARFRTWLKRVADNAILNALSRRRPDRACGGNGSLDLRDHPADAGAADLELLHTEYRREVFRHAAEQARTEFSGPTWDAFWRTAVDGVSVEQAAGQLGRTRGSVYASRSRVMKRLKEIVERMDDDRQQGQS